MSRISRAQIGWAFLALFVPGLLVAAEQPKMPKLGQYNPADQTVEMFQAIQAGQIRVRAIPKDSTQCRVMIENKTTKPLNVKLPEAFACVPVLAQAGVGGRAGGGHAGGRTTGGGGGQTTGGGMGMGMGGMGMFNVPPEIVGQLKARTVCLDHGKGEPNPRIPYEIKPLDSVTQKPGVHELCQMLGAGQISQRAAQVAAWHLNNDMSFEELAAKQIHRAGGARQPYFTPQEIQEGMQAASLATQQAEQRKSEMELPSSSSSSSSHAD